MCFFSVLVSRTSRRPELRNVKSRSPIVEVDSDDENWGSTGASEDEFVPVKKSHSTNEDETDSDVPESDDSDSKKRLCQNF